MLGITVLRFMVNNVSDMVQSIYFSLAPNAHRHYIKQAFCAAGICHQHFIFWEFFFIIHYVTFLFLAATKQFYEWFSPSVCLSVCLHVTPFWLCSHHRIVMKLSGVITNDRSDVHAKGKGQRSKVKVTEVNTQLSRFRTVTPVWIHIWWWNDAQSLK